jgi:hypothetical protein
MMRAVSDLGLRFVDPPASSRLRPAGSFAQSTHLVGLTSVAGVDHEVRALLRTAYEQNA